MKPNEIQLFKGYYESLIHNIVHYGTYYVSDSKLSSLVVGISGGVDSAVVTIIASRICKILKIQLHGFYLHIDGNKSDEGERAYSIGSKFCNTFSTVSLNQTFFNLVPSIDSSLSKIKNLNSFNFQEKIRLGNIKARLRMIYLYNQSQAQNGLVLSTDNLTEYYLGFWTLHGDVGDLGLIQSLWKTEVYEIGKLLGPECMECVNANPTDGLGITNSDIDQLLPDWTPEQGTHIDAYRKIDEILIDYLTMGCKLTNPVIQIHQRSEFKRRNPFNIERSLLIKKENL